MVRKILISVLGCSDVSFILFSSSEDGCICLREGEGGGDDDVDLETKKIIGQERYTAHINHISPLMDSEAPSCGGGRRVSVICLLILHFDILIFNNPLIYCFLIFQNFTHSLA